MKNTASALWKGNGADGAGTIQTQSHVLNNVPYSYRSRTITTENTNPEELIAAAHAGCFAMKLAFALSTGGYNPETIETRCELTFEAGVITHSKLGVSAKVPGIAQPDFERIVAHASQNCPVSQLMKAAVSVQSAKLL